VFAFAQRIPGNCSFFGPIASEYSTFFLGNYNLLGSDNEGNVAAGGNADFSGSGVGFGLTGTCNKNSFHGGPETIVVGGNVNMSHGEIYNGDTVIGGQNFVDPNKVYFYKYCDVYVSPNFIDFNSAFDFLRNLSTDLCALTPTGNFTIQEKSRIVLNEQTEAAVQVFEIDGTTVLNSKYWTLNVDPATTEAIIINVRGPVSGFGGLGGVSLSQFENYKTRTLWNFCDATEIQLKGVGVIGSILAPWADFNNPKGEAYGQIFGVNWNGPLQQHAVYFDYCPPAPTTVPTTTLPTTTAPPCCCPDNNNECNATCCGSVTNQTFCWINAQTGPCCLCCAGEFGIIEEIYDSYVPAAANSNKTTYTILFSISGALLLLSVVIGGILIHRRLKKKEIITETKKEELPLIKSDK